MSDRKRVLVVDDDRFSREVLCAALNDQFDVVAAADAVEGLAVLEHQPIDAIISDFVMPGADGLEFLTTVKARYPGVGGVLITGHRDYPEVQEALRSSRFTILFKPVEVEKLRCWVTNATTMTRIKRDTDRLRATAMRQIVDETS